MCCRLNDIKALVAYRSVAHISLVIIGLFIIRELGYNGALMIMLGHGIASSGLFCALNIYYERSGSRRFFLNNGIIMVLPVFSLMFFILCAANIAAPPSINLLAEIYLMARIFSFDRIILVVFPAGSFLGAVFRIFLFSYRQHGRMVSSILNYYEIRVIELIVLSLHIIPLYFLVLKFEFLILWL